MVQTSEAYRPFPTVRKVDALISFEVIAKALSKKEVDPSASEAARAGSLEETLNGVSEVAKKYATAERYGWRLDGTASIMPDSSPDVGFWSTSISDESGNFSTPIVLRYDLPSPTNTFGWTFHFDAPTQIWADSVHITCYDAEDVILDEYDAFPEGTGELGAGWSVYHFVRDYSAVEFEFRHLNEPLRMLRFAEVDFGISRHYNSQSINDVTIKYGLSIDSSEFPAKELKFQFDNSDQDFNVLNPIGVYQYWRNGQVLTARFKLGDDVIPMGMFYVNRAEVGSNRLYAKVTALDPTYQLSRQTFYPGELAELDSVPLETVVTDMLSGLDLAVNFNGLENEPVSVAVRDTHNKRTILRYLAQAVRASIWIDRDNVIQFKRFTEEDLEEAVGEITPDELYGWDGVSIAEEFTGVTLMVTRELESDEHGNDVQETYIAGTDASTTAYENPCVAASRGQDVAEWLLWTANWSKKYEVKNRCDPAVEIGDTLMIADVFKNDDNAVVTGIEISYNGVLTAKTKAARVF